MICSSFYPALFLFYFLLFVCLHVSGFFYLNGEIKMYIVYQILSPIGEKMYVTQQNCSQIVRPILPVIFTARLYASVIYATALCLFVCLSICHKPVFYHSKEQ